jgi:hypothetical protein
MYIYIYDLYSYVGGLSVVGLSVGGMSEYDFIHPGAIAMVDCFYVTKFLLWILKDDISSEGFKFSPFLHFRCGLQKQFESVCENIGLIGFLLHSEPSLER